jgi:hypothetical protein
VRGDDERRGAAQVEAHHAEQVGLDAAIDEPGECDVGRVEQVLLRQLRVLEVRGDGQPAFEGEAREQHLDAVGDPVRLVQDHQTTA